MALLAACSGQDATSVQSVAALSPGGSSGAGGSASSPALSAGADAGGSESEGEPPLYVTSSLVFGPDGTTTYVALLDSLEAQTIDYSKAREFSGSSDLWVYAGELFIADAESNTIRKYGVEDGALVERASASFAAYGLTSFGFWLNTFVSPSKAYFLNGAAEYIVWNPSTMDITGTVPLPELPARPGLQLFPAYADRAAVLRDGRLYQPLYWTDESYFIFAPDSVIAVIDVASDSVAELIPAPCPGLDYATVAEDSSIYFSSWVYGAGGAAVLDQPPTCVFQVPAQGAPAVAFSVADVTGGRQGAALRYIGGGRGLISVLYGERAEPGVAAGDFTFANNWRFWSYDFNTHEAALIDSVDWNGGAEYAFDIGGETLMLVAASDYTATTVYRVGEDLNPTPVFDTRGWAVRLFQVR